MSIPARYSGYCPECGERWQPGDLIRSDDRDPDGLPIWAHAVCPDVPVQQLRRQLAAAHARIDTEIDWQHQIAARAKQENAEALDQQRRRYEDAMDRWHRLGQQADRLLTAAKRTGRKTLRVHDFTEHTA